MRLQIALYLPKIAKPLTIHCIKAYIDWEEDEITCLMPDNIKDRECCTFNMIFRHSLKSFDKIEAIIRDNWQPFLASNPNIHAVKLERIEGTLEITEGYPAYLNDTSLTEAKLKLIQKRENGGRI